MKWTEDDLKQVLDYLRKKVDIFKEVREKFNIGEVLGLASLPERHYFADGLLAAAVLKNGRDHVYVRRPTENSNAVSIELVEIPPDRLIVKPVYSDGKANFVSVYFPPGIIENTKGATIDKSYFQAQDEVLKGIFSHEGAEYLLHYNRELIPLERIAAMEEKILSGGNRFWVCRQFKNQCRADLLASMFGYRKEIIFYIKFRIEIISGWEDFSAGSVYASYYRRPSELVEELRARLDFIESAA